MNFNRPIALVFALSVFASLRAADSADLSFRFTPGQSAKYEWSTSSSTESSGREMGKPFTITSESSMEMNVLFKALPRRNDTPGQPLLMKIEKYSYKDKKSVGEEVGEIVVGKGKIKATQSGKAIVDSENDIGLEEVKSFQQLIRKIEDGEVRASLDSNGKFAGELSGETEVLSIIRSSGAESLPRLLAGHEVAVGEKWADSQTMTHIASFKLAKPAVVRSTATFKGWEEKNGKKLARIDIDAVWDPADLKGENDDGLLVEITRVQGASAATCLFDPTTGQYTEGRFDVLSKYRIDGKREGQSTGLNVTGKMSFAFKAVQ